MIFNESIENLEQIKLKNQKQSDYKLLEVLKHILFIPLTRIVWKKSSILIPAAFFCPPKIKSPYSGHLVIVDTLLETSVRYRQVWLHNTTASV